MLGQRPPIRSLRNVATNGGMTARRTRTEKRKASDSCPADCFSASFSQDFPRASSHSLNWQRVSWAFLGTSDSSSSLSSRQHGMVMGELLDLVLWNEREEIDIMASLLDEEGDEVADDDSDDDDAFMAYKARLDEEASRNARGAAPSLSASSSWKNETASAEASSSTLNAIGSAFSVSSLRLNSLLHIRTPTEKKPSRSSLRASAASGGMTERKEVGWKRKDTMERAFMGDLDEDEGFSSQEASADRGKKGVKQDDTLENDDSFWDNVVF